jgi:hypothetical protein
LSISKQYEGDTVGAAVLEFNQPYPAHNDRQETRLLAKKIII